MNLYEKIVCVYPSLTLDDFKPDTGTILLKADVESEMVGYIAVWNHPTLAQPTQEQLDAVEAN